MTIENYFERRIRPLVEETKSKAENESYNSYESHDNYDSYKSYESYNTNKNNTISTTATKKNTIIDEDQLARTFQEIVNCINLDDDEGNDNYDSLNNNNFSRSNFHHSHHSLLPEFNSIFGGANSSFNIAVGSGDTKGKSNTGTTGGLGKSFLDDDWFPMKKSSESVSVLRSAPATIVNARPMTPNSSISSSFNNRNNGEYFLRDGNSYNNLPPNDYICKLCNCDGHWMKDCRLYEPRTPPSSISSFKSTNSLNSSTSATSATMGNRTLLPPGNYVCRLCNVAGHWIDQCSKFQPKNEPAASNNSAPPVLPPMLGPGPTPNYRPPAYLSKPVPSNYICNLCNRPGHWIQQCTEFTPIINHKPKGF